MAEAQTAGAQPQRPCLQAVDGTFLARVQDEVRQLMPKVQADPAFGGGWFEHSPCYRMVLAFTDGRPRPWVIEAAPAHLRPYLGFARTHFSQAEREAAGEQIRTALGARGIDFTFGTRLRPEVFLVGVRTEADARIARSLIPERYRVITSVGPEYYARRVPER